MRMRIWCLVATLGVTAGVWGQGGDRVEGLLERLSNAAGPPGAEEPVRSIVVGEMKGLATVRCDMTGWGQ